MQHLNLIWQSMFIVCLKNYTVSHQAVVVHSSNSTTRHAEAGWSLWVSGQPGLQSEHHDNQDYTGKPCHENKQAGKQYNFPLAAVGSLLIHRIKESVM